MSMKRTFETADLEMANLLYTAAEDIMDKLDITEVMVEPFVQLVPDSVGGSIDLLGISADCKTAMILDYKTGRHRVSAKDNAQLNLYAASAMADPLTAALFKQVKKIVFVIVQPPVKHAAQTWETTPKKVEAFAKKFIKATEKTTLHPGKHCDWCPAAPTCAVKRAHVVASAQLGGRVLEELQASADVIVEVEEWVNATKQEMYIQMQKGAALKGWKVVAKVAKRKWIDPAAALKVLKGYDISEGDIFAQVMVSAPQMEKILKAQKREIDFLDPLVEKVSSGTTMAQEDDSRPAVVASENPDNLKALVNSAQ